MSKDEPKTVEEAWDLFQSRRFLHGHRESPRESFELIMRDLFPSQPHNTKQPEE